MDSHFDPGVVRIEVFDELFAGFDAQQSCLGNIVADADDDLVEDSQGIVHECLMAPVKGSNDPGKMAMVCDIGSKGNENEYRNPTNGPGVLPNVSDFLQK